MKNLAIINTLTSTLSKAGLKLQKHSPEILAAVGTVGVVASAVMACRATTKVSTILDKSKEMVDAIHNATEDQTIDYTKEDATKDLTITYVQTSVKLVKLYGPSVALGAISLGCLLTSNNILRKRNIALAAAYATIDKSFKEYRGRVIERFGEAVDRELKYNITKQKIEETVKDPETGEEKKVEKEVEVTGLNGYSEYARFFDDGCKGWEKDAEMNLMFLRAQQQYANDLLRARKYLFLNDVYDMLGIPRTKAGQIVGWVYDPDRTDIDNYVDFGMYDLNKPKARDFVNGYERTILLDFNVDGNILDLI